MVVLVTLIADILSLTMVNPVFQLVQYAYAINVVLASTTSRTSRSHPWG